MGEFELNLLFPFEAVDQEEEIYDDLLQEIHNSQLENISAGLSENSRDSNSIDSPIVLNIISILIHIFNDGKWWYEKVECISSSL